MDQHLDQRFECIGGVGGVVVELDAAAAVWRLG